MSAHAEGSTAGRVVDGWRSVYGAPDEESAEKLGAKGCAAWVAAVAGRGWRVRPGGPGEQPFVVEVSDAA